MTRFITLRSSTGPSPNCGSSMQTRKLGTLILIAAIALLLGSARAQTSAEMGDVLFVCQHGNVKSVMAASYFNRLAVERGMPYRASARGSQVDTPEVPAAIATKLRAEGFEVNAYRAAPATAADLQAAKRIVLIETSLPSASVDSASKAERWDDVPPASIDYSAASAALRAHIEKLLDELGNR